MGPYLGLKFFGLKPKKNGQYCPNLGVSLKSNLRFFNKPPNVRVPCGGGLDTLTLTLHHTLPLTLHHIFTLSFMLDSLDSHTVL